MEDQAEFTPREAETLPAIAQTTPLSSAETSWRLSERQALAISKAQGAIPKAFCGRPGDIVAVWMMADELGISRMGALRGMYVVNGKPQLSGDMLMAVALGARCKVSEKVRTVEDEAGGTVDIIATCEVTRPDGQTFVAEFSMSDAQFAGLWGSTDPWRKYPRRMLQMRARGFAMRDAIPDKLAGVYAPGELIDVTPEG